MVYLNLATGEYECRISRQKLEACCKRWADKPETKAMFAKFRAERQAFVEKVLDEMKEDSNGR